METTVLHEPHESRDSHEIVKKSSHIFADTITPIEREYIVDYCKYFRKFPDDLLKTVSVLLTNVPSLRLIDKFVMQMSYYEAISFPAKDKLTGERKIFFVFDEYKKTLSSTGNDFFDSCKRGKKYLLNYQNGDRCSINNTTSPDELTDVSDQYIEVSTGQMNYFKWLNHTEPSVIDYIIGHIDIIKHWKKTENKQKTTKLNLNKVKLN